QRGDPMLALLTPTAEDHLVLANAVVRQVVGIGQAHAQVVGGEHRVVADLTKARVAVATDIGISTQVHAEVAGEGPDLADALLTRPLRLQCKPRARRGATCPGVALDLVWAAFHEHRHRLGQEGGQALAGAYGPGSLSPAAVRR